MLSTSEETLRQEFSRFKPGSVERVKKLTDYAFIHYRCRDDAVTALSLMNGAQIDGAALEVTLAKPAAVKEGSVAGRRYNSRGYLGNNNNNQAAAGGNGGAAAGNGTFLLHRNDGGMVGGIGDTYSPMRTLSLPPPRLGSPFYGGAGRTTRHGRCRKLQINPCCDEQVHRPLNVPKIIPKCLIKYIKKLKIIIKMNLKKKHFKLNFNILN